MSAVHIRYERTCNTLLSLCTSKEERSAAEDYATFVLWFAETEDNAVQFSACNELWQWFGENKPLAFQLIKRMP